ncbi:Flagellar biosynthetic protein FlhB [Pseudomonas fluorescens]|uniref:EscU/YscU/HrcU family type III secretion system export apparatus switch protein n=1 Tax=Pseudomonas fluorescens TaxID=294 RepID=UPI001253330D|nr:flagellar type III secretion system protein FlhB [Pseudomonas fluorescens]CAG8863192.1 Flagellar biosynthetic protein FlhB [Pseudomonas fluorescens]VVP69010.1 Flagellar biosynthetic protein FlhB [Pseudomonas fluorescens]
MSNNSAQEKTEEASAQKLRKSRDDGQVTRSKDLSTTVSLLATLLILKFSFMGFYEGLLESFRLSFLNFNASEVSQEDLRLILTHNLVLFIRMLLPLVLTSVLVITFSLVPGGWLFVAKNFFPKFSKLNPITGLARIVSAQNWVELLKSLAKIALLITVAWMLVSDAIPHLLALQRTNLPTAIGSAFALLFDTLLSLLGVFVVFALIDVPIQKYFFLKKLRMTKQERKEEHRNQEGRPEVKARIKRIQRQMSQGQIGKVMKDADAIIVNPQHYAVAIKYDVKKAQAPYVIAKGVDDMALFIRKMAMSHNLEVLEIPPLARAIYFTTQVNQQIPAPLYAAVAHVLTYILQLKAYKSGLRARPELPRDLPIPERMANKA